MSKKQTKTRAAKMVEEQSVQTDADACRIRVLVCDPDECDEDGEIVLATIPLADLPPELAEFFAGVWDEPHAPGSAQFH